MNKKKFLKGTVTLGLIGLLGIGLKQNPKSDFGSIYNQAIEFVQSYNDDHIQGKKGLENCIIEFNELKTDLEEKGVELDAQNLAPAVQFFNDNGKVFHGGKFVDIDKKIIPRYIIGDINKKWREHFDYNGKGLDYDVVLFEQSTDTLVNKMGRIDVTAFWDEDTKTAFINLTQENINAENVYKFGESIGENYKGDFFGTICSEFYSKLMQRARKNHPLLSKINPFVAFKKEYINYNIESAKYHERMHHFYNGQGELMPLLAEIAAQPELNSGTFTIATKEVYNYFEQLGYNKEDLMKMPSENRAIIAGYII